MSKMKNVLSVDPWCGVVSWMSAPDLTAWLFARVTASLEVARQSTAVDAD